MVWFTRLRGFVQKGLEPVLGRLRPLPTASPTSWYSQSPTWSLATPNFATSELPRQQGPVEPPLRSLPQALHQSSTGSIQPEVVQEEVRKAVQQAMMQRDHRVNDLQAENSELRQLLMTVMEAGTESRGVGDVSGPAADGGAGHRDVGARTASATGATTSGQGDPPLLPAQACELLPGPPGLSLPVGLRGGIPGGSRVVHERGAEMAMILSC